MIENAFLGKSGGVASALSERDFRVGGNFLFWLIGVSEEAFEGLGFFIVPYSGISICVVSCIVA